MNIVFDVNLEFLDKAEKQIFETLLKQRLSFNERWSNSPIFLKLKPILRIVGLALSISGAVLCAAVFISWGANWHPSSKISGIFIVLFVILGCFFYFLPTFETVVKNWTHNLSLKSCKKLSAKSVKDARKQAPYRAEYDIKHGSISYYREKDGEAKLAWTRNLKGVAIQGNFATIIFKKWTSFMPSIVILHEDLEAIGKALREQTVDCRLIDEI